MKYLNIELILNISEHMKDEVLSFVEKICIDEYLVFWVYQVKELRYTTNLTSNLEWGQYIPSNSTKFDEVVVTKVFQKSEETFTEEQEQTGGPTPQISNPEKNSNLIKIKRNLSMARSGKSQNSLENLLSPYFLMFPMSCFPFPPECNS